MKYLYISIILFCSAIFSSLADDLDNAKELFEAEDYASALPIFVNLIESQPKNKNIGQLNQWAGECAYYLGDLKSAEDFFKKANAKNIAEANRFLGQIAYLNYNFYSAKEYYAKFQQLTKKAKKEIPDDVVNEINRVSLAETMLERVEKIIIIDSIAVPRKDFFLYYKISPDCGSLNIASFLPFNLDSDSICTVFTNEDRDFMMWAATDSSGYFKLNESVRLIDKTWHAPTQLDILPDNECDARFPFMLTDGATLYFASNGENSIGGYDIFISRKDYEENEYMTPTNVGMPYNSPYDDYMYAIDENLGVGWWATDRNKLPNDMITIYVFIKNDIRTSYNIDDEFITNYARISDYKSTWEENDYSNILNQISLIYNNNKDSDPDFYFIIRPGITYTSLDDFKSVEGKQYMKLYLEELDKFNYSNNRLAELRKQYHQSHSNALISEIQSLEAETEHLRKNLSEIKNNIYKLER